MSEHFSNDQPTTLQKFSGLGVLGSTSHVCCETIHPRCQRRASRNWWQKAPEAVARVMWLCMVSLWSWREVLSANKSRISMNSPASIRCTKQDGTGSDAGEKIKPKRELVVDEAPDNTWGCGSFIVRTTEGVGKFGCSVVMELMEAGGDNDPRGKGVPREACERAISRQNLWLSLGGSSQAYLWPRDDAKNPITITLILIVTTWN